MHGINNDIILRLKQLLRAEGFHNLGTRTIHNSKFMTHVCVSEDYTSDEEVYQRVDARFTTDGDVDIMRSEVNFSGSEKPERKMQEINISTEELARIFLSWLEWEPFTEGEK